MDLARTSTIGFRLEAVSTVVLKATMDGAVLPADRAHTVIALLAGWVAHGSVLFHALRAVGKRLTDGAATGLLPARVADISVMVVVMVVSDGCTVIVLFAMREGLF